MNGQMTRPRGSRHSTFSSFRRDAPRGKRRAVDVVPDPDYHPDREALNVGADREWLKIAPGESVRKTALLVR